MLEFIQLASDGPDADKAGCGVRPADSLAEREVSSASPS